MRPYRYSPERLISIPGALIAATERRRADDRRILRDDDARTRKALN